MLVCRDWSMIPRMKLYWGIPIFFLVAAPWFYAVNQATDGKWLADFIYIHHIRRYPPARASPAFLLLLDDIASRFSSLDDFIVPALSAYRPLRSRLTDPVVQFFLVWFAAVFLFFSFSDTKRDLYLLPLLPTLALFLGRYFDDLTHGRIAQDFLYRSWTSFFSASLP
jgi:4-amino-4-deoxy-L-arabinose transferase-like glycosyltransferase